MGRPVGSRSALGARASTRNLGNTARKGRQTKRERDMEKMADRREKARLEREEAQAIREQARARQEAGELCFRSEAMVEVQRIQRIVRSELDRALAYLDPGLAPEVRAACEAAIGTAVRKLRSTMADKVDGGVDGR